MDSNGGGPRPDQHLRAQLDTARTALHDSVRHVRASGGSDPAGLIRSAREIQRLVEALVAELARRAASTPGTAPIDSVLGDGGTVPRRQVRTEIERARITAEFPALGSAMSNGETPTANVDVLARITGTLNDAEAESFRKHDADLADAAARLSEESFRKRATRLRDRIRSDGGTTAAAQVVADSYVRLSPSSDRDAYRINGYIDPLRGAAIKAAVERETKLLADDPAASRGMTAAQLAAQALHDLVLRGDTIDRTFVPRANVRVHVLCDRDTLVSGPHERTIAETHEGLAVGARAVGRLCCDSTIRRIDTAPDGNVHVSRTSRAPSEAQRMALRALYPSCPISGAGWESIEIHHVVFFGESKRTVLHELVPVSRRWHHLIHDDGWILTMDPDRTLHLSRPDGTPFRTIPPPVPINQHDHDLAA